MQYEDKLRLLKAQVQVLQSEYDNITGQLNNAEAEFNKNNDLIVTYKDEIKLAKKASEVMNIVQKITKDKAKETFEKLVTYALRFICQEDCQFEIELGKRGNLPEAYFKIHTEEFEEYHDITTCNAGGKVNILSLAMRVVLLELKRPKIEGPLLLDETFTNLSVGYLPMASKFLDIISEKINRQIIMVTHKKEFLHGDVNLILMDKPKKEIEYEEA